MSDPSIFRLPILSDEPLERRAVLQLIGAGVAFSACEPSRGKILPYIREPKEMVAGRPQTYATAMTEGGVAWGLLVQSHAGRPIKVDGNPDHPTTLGGGSMPQLQASLYDLYDPSRGRGMREGRQAKSWSGFLREFSKLPAGGQGMHFLLEPTSSPLLIRQIESVQQTYPQATFHFFDPLRNRGQEAALQAAFGGPRQLQLAFDKVRSVVSFDADFLTVPQERIRWAFDFAKTRRVREVGDEMSRLWVAEGDLTVTGAMADHRLRMRPSGIPSLLGALVAALARRAGAQVAPGGQQADPAARAWVEGAADDLWRNRGASIVLAGARHGPEAHLAALLANHLLGNLGTTVTFTDPVIHQAGQQSHDLEPLIGALEGGQVDTLFLLGGNPIYTAPRDLGLERAVRRAKRSLYLGSHENQTAAACTWYVPSLHFLERWGDARAHDGTISLTQPLVRPFWGGKSAVQLLAAIAGDPNPDDEALLRGLYESIDTAGWQTALQWGFLAGALPVRPEQPNEQVLRDAVGKLPPPPAGDGIEISIRPDPKLRDGASAQNAWLVELPDPITSIAWKNAALLSPTTAKRLGVGDKGRLVEVRRGDVAIRIPAFPVRGMADGLVSLSLGWGQQAPTWSGGRPTKKEIAGTDVGPLRTSASQWILSGASASLAKPLPHGFLESPSLEERIPVQQDEHDMQGRAILLTAPLATWQKQPNFVHPHDLPSPDLYGAPWTYHGEQWGMSIDLTTCIGCSACVVACQAENNTPTVGEVNAHKARMMHWLRIDRYYLGDTEDDVQYLPQPMLCQHCERAPCEYVCPVNATVHSPDGLNEMVYNRCIGTRFCSNNCPYKVRRFNYLRYNGPLEPETLKMIHNPNVTVRERGVMEKCTYCVQRIRTAQIEARIEGRNLRDGDVRTACQVACPTEAIVFGLVSDPESEVSKLHRSQRSYSVLNHDLGTEPRTRYLAHLRNDGGS